MKADESGCDVLWLGAGEDPGSRVLHILEPVQGFGRELGQYSIAVVQAGGDKAWMRVSATGSEREGQSLEMFLRW